MKTEVANKMEKKILNIILKTLFLVYKQNIIFIVIFKNIKTKNFIQVVHPISIKLFFSMMKNTTNQNNNINKKLLKKEKSSINK